MTAIKIVNKVFAFIFITSILINFSANAAPGTRNSISHGICDSLKLISFLYTKHVKDLNSSHDSISRHYMSLGYKNGTLKGWISNSGVNLMDIGLIKASGCFAIYPEGDTCAVGIWDGKSSCFVSGITRNSNPSFMIRHFGGTNDIGFVIYDLTSSGEYRQIMIYRPGVGAVYSWVITPFKDESHLLTHEVLDSVIYETKKGLVIRRAPLLPSPSALDTAARWIRTIKFEDISEGQIIPIDWDSVRTKVMRQSTIL